MKMGNGRFDDRACKRLARVATLSMLVVLVAYTLWYLTRYSDFNSDDLDNFRLLQSKGFWSFLLTPNEVHHVPLHRLLTWLVYRVAPMNFSVAAVVSIAFHVGTLVYLWRILRLLDAEWVGGLLVCGYAASSLILFGLVWWAHAEHRAPYVMMDVYATYHYLAWLRKPRARHLSVMVLAFAVALGFYGKAVMIPLHMLVVGYLCGWMQNPNAWRIRVFPPLLLAIGSVLYVLGYLFFHPASVQSTLVQVFCADLEFLKMLFSASSGIGMETVREIPLYGWSWQLAMLSVLGLLLLHLSLSRGGGSWKVLLVMLLVLLLDNLPMVFSGRIAQYGFMIPRQYRFGYEELHLLVIFAGLWWIRVRLATLSDGQGRLAWSCMFVLVAGYALVNA